MLWLLEERRVTGIPFCLELREVHNEQWWRLCRFKSVVRSVQIDGIPSRRFIIGAFREILCASSHVQQRNTATFRSSFEFRAYVSTVTILPIRIELT
jgi:hypothetical protein